MMAELGITEPMADSYAVRWDKREDLPEPIDLGWIGEGPDGIWARHHVEAALVEDVQIQDTVTTWRCASERQLRRDDVAVMSNWELAAWGTMLSAHNREELRRMKRREEDGA